MKDKIIYIFYDENEVSSDPFEECEDDELFSFIDEYRDSILFIEENQLKQSDTDLSEYTNYLKLKVVESGFIKKEFLLNPNKAVAKKKKMVK